MYQHSLRVLFCRGGNEIVDIVTLWEATCGKTHCCTLLEVPPVSVKINFEQVDKTFAIARLDF